MTDPKGVTSDIPVHLEFLHGLLCYFNIAFNRNAYSEVFIYFLRAFETRPFNAALFNCCVLLLVLF